VSKLTRSQARREERENEKIRNRTYTYSEMKRLVTMALTNQEREYDMRYALVMASTLSSEPYNFRSKRVCAFTCLFFDQIGALDDGRITLDELKIEAAKVGVLLKERGIGLEVYTDPKYKYKKGDVLK